MGLWQKAMPRKGFALFPVSGAHQKRGFVKQQRSGGFPFDPQVVQRGRSGQGHVEKAALRGADVNHHRQVFRPGRIGQHKAKGAGGIFVKARKEQRLCLGDQGGAVGHLGHLFLLQGAWVTPARRYRAG
jgi:hypothetical protein